MLVKHKIVSIVLVFCFCALLAGCESTKNTIQKADDWVKETLW